MGLPIIGVYPFTAVPRGREAIIMSGTLHFTLRGIPMSSPTRRPDSREARGTQTRQGVAKKVAPCGPGAIPEGWIDLLLGETNLDTVYPQEE